MCADRGLRGLGPRLLKAEPCEGVGSVGVAALAALLRLICFPCAGSGGSFFNCWRASLPKHLRFHAITLPGRHERIAETPFTSFDHAIEAIADDLAPDNEGHDVYFGHSLGALIAFEAARRNLDQALPEPALLIVAGSLPPSEVDAPAIARRSHAPSDELLEEVYAADPTRAGVLYDHPELRDLTLSAWRSDLRIAGTYHYTRSTLLSCPIIALSGTFDPRASTSTMAGWREETRGRFEQREFVGDHMFVRELAREVVETITAHILANGS